MRLAGLHRMSIVWLTWFLLPFVPLVVDMFLGWFRTSTRQPLVMQESGLQFKAMAAFALGWLLLGLVPTLMLHARSLGKSLLVDIFWCALAGWYWGPAILAACTAPPASSVGEPCAFELAESFKQSVEVRPTNGPAAGVRFSLGSAEWGDASRRTGGRSVPGKVYKGGRDLWFAKLD
jgi:hypothetical protein